MTAAAPTLETTDPQLPAGSEPSAGPATVARGQLQRSWRSATAAPGPAFVLPGLPPLLMAVVLPALFDRISLVTGFGDTGLITYLAPGAVTLTAMLGGGFTTASLVTDLRDGYADRLRLLVPSPLGLVLGRAAVEAARIVPAAAVVLVVAAVIGADVTFGVGLLVALLLVALLSAAFGHLFHLAGVGSGDPATAASMAPLGLLLGFLSTALVPTAVMPRWAATVADANPVSIVTEGVRAALGGEPASGEVFAAAAVGIVGIALGSLAVTARIQHQTTRS